MAKKPAETSGEPMDASTSASSDTSTSKPAAPRERVVTALMELAAEERWDAITLPMIASRAGVTLMDLREVTPSKGALLGLFAKQIDRRVLESLAPDMNDEPMRDRLLDIMLKRFDALAPYKEALRNIRKYGPRDPLSLVALNGVATNSWRFMLAAADTDTEDDLGQVRVQGAAMVFARAFDTWLDDEDPGLTRTMAALDKELKRGETIMGRIDDLHRMTAPLRGFARAVMEGRHRSRSGSRDEGRSEQDPQDGGAPLPM